MFGDINIENLKPRKPSIFLCKPDTTTIAKLSEAYDVRHTTRLGDLNEISMSIPYTVEVRKRHTKNENIELIRERYLIKVSLDETTEYYVINKIEESSDDSKEIKQIKAMSLGYQLRDKMVRNYNEIGITARQAMQDALDKTVWSLGKNLSDPNHYFNSSSSTGSGGRSFDIPSATSLDFVIQIAEAFNAVIIWDTINKVIDFELPASIGINRGLRIAYGKYLQTLGRESNTDEMVTRLTPFGHEGLTIHSFNPTGSGYIEDFSYFMYPFKRNDFGDVIQSSYYMSDGLCHAILDYKNKVESYRNNFSDLLEEINRKQSEKTSLENEHYSMLTDMYMMQDRITAKKSIQEYDHFDMYHDKGTTIETIEHNEDAFYVIMAYAHGDSGSTVKIDGQAIALPKKGQWAVVNRRNIGYSSTRFSIEGNSLTDVTFILTSVTEDEYYDATNTEIINKYNESVLDTKMQSKQNEIDGVQEQTDQIVEQVNYLQDILSVERNFTPEQIVERNQFIIEKEYTNDNILSAEELYKHAEEEFEKLREPQVVININIVNFLEVVEAHRDWGKLRLGDTIKIEHERLGVEVSAKLIGIEYDYEGQKINLTIANVKDIKNDEDKLIDALYGAISTSTTVEMSKFKWNKAEETEKTVNSIMTEAWDITERHIQSKDGDLQLSDDGFKIISKDDPNRFLVARYGVIAITKTGGKRWEHAITTDGIIGERIIGKILVGENLIIENSSGSFRMDENGVTITDAGLNIVTSNGEAKSLEARFNEQKSYAEELVEDLQGEMKDIDIALGNLDIEINTTFRDGIIDEAEKISIKQHIEQLKSEKADVDKRYTTIYANPYLNGSSKSNLKVQKDMFDLRYAELVNAINTAIADGSIIDNERSNVESKFSAYQVSIGNLMTSFENAVDTISKNKAIEAERNAVDHADELKTMIDKDINDVEGSIVNLNEYVDTSFKDGVINTAEKKAIAEHIETLNSDKKDVDDRYTNVYNNSDLDGSAKTGLATAKSNYNTAHSQLISAINTAIADSTIIADERSNVDSKFNAYRTRVGQLSVAFENAINTISENKKKSAMTYADGLKQIIEGDIGDVDKKIGDLNNYIDGSFQDGVIEQAEAKAISSYINSLNSEKSDLDNRYTIIYNNSYLKTSAVKSDLYSKKNAYNTSHSSLINEINSAISDGKTTSGEKTRVDNAFGDYRLKLGALATSFENAVDDISKHKSGEAEANAKAEAKKAHDDAIKAQEDATKANQLLSDISDDNKITPLEKQNTKKEWDIINSEYSKNISEANTFAVSTTNYTAKYNTLKTYIEPIISNLTTTNTIVGSTFRLRFKEYYDSRTDLLNSISSKAKQLANDAQSTADRAWGKFSGAGNSLPAGSVTFGNGLNASVIEQATLNFNNRNDRNSTTPRNPVVDRTVGGALVDSIDHTINTDGSVNISFEWDFDDSGNAGDIDGFIVYIMQGTSSSAYSFGTSEGSEVIHYVAPEKRAFIIHGVPANKYYTFGIQAYRIVDKDVAPNGVIKSAVVKSVANGHNPYRPMESVAFDGKVTGTIGNNTPATTVEARSNNSLQDGTNYNSVNISTNAGLVATRSDNKARTVINATDGISVQRYESGLWNKKFFVDTNGNLNIVGNITMEGGSISWGNINKPTYTASEVGARPNTWTPTATEVGARPSNWMPTASQVGARPSNWLPQYDDILNAKPQTYIDSSGIYTGRIIAGQIVADNLSAISANIGNITAGSIKGVSIEGGTLKQSGTSGSMVIDSKGLTNFDASGTARISITTSNDSFQRFSPSTISFEPNKTAEHFIVGTGTHGLGDAVVGYVNNSQGRYFNIRNIGGRIQLDANAIYTLGENHVERDTYRNLLSLKRTGDTSPSHWEFSLPNGDLSIGASPANTIANRYVTIKQNGQFVSQYGIQSESDVSVGYRLNLCNSGNMVQERFALQYNSTGDTHFMSYDSSGNWNNRLLFNGRSANGGVDIWGDVRTWFGHMNSRSINHINDGFYSHFYVRGLTGSQVRFTSINTTDSYVTINAANVSTSSLEKFKENITKWDSGESALDLINRTTIYKYRLKEEILAGIDKTRHGLVIGEGYNTPEELMSTEKDGIEQYQMNTINMRAIQEQQEIINELRQELTQTRLELNAVKEKIQRM